MTTMTSETLLESLLPADLPLSMSDTSFSTDENFENLVLVKNAYFVEMRCYIVTNVLLIEKLIQQFYSKYLMKSTIEI